MDSPPVPKPRITGWPQNEPIKRPVPLPRTKIPTTNDKVSASDILRSISSVSKQITEDVAQKVSNSAKSANEIAKGTIEKTITTSRAVRDSVTKSVIDGTRTAGLRLRKVKKIDYPDTPDTNRCVSMPAVDVSLFDSIQFNSPLLEQKKYKNDASDNPIELPSSNLNLSHFDNLSLFSSNSDSNTDTVSNFSFDSKDFEQNSQNWNLNSEKLTYDTPKLSRINSIVNTMVTPEVPEKNDTPKSSKINSIVNTMATPEVPERRKKRQSSIDIMRQNSLYENWNIPVQNELPNSRPSNSTIYEFDPLNTSSKSPKYEGISNELLLLESFLIGDTYGSIISNDSYDDGFDDFRENDYFNPPTPPERSDSLFTNETQTQSNIVASTSGSSNLIQDNELDNKSNASVETKQSNTVIQKFSHILKLENVLNKSNKQSPQKLNIVERPSINILPVPYYCGILTRIVSGVVEDLFKNSQTRYCILSDQKLKCYTDPTNSILKEAYTLDSIYSVQIVLPLSSTTSSNSYCFELSVSTGSLKAAPRKILFSCGSAPERRQWVQKLAEHLTSEFPTKYTAEFTRCGWCYLKEGVSGEWRGAWLMLIRRVLVYYTCKEPTVCTVDLRKTRCVVTRTADEETKQACPGDGDQILLLDCPHATIYLRFPHDRELKGWRYMVKLAAHNNGAQIHHQQLTKEDVPTLVDKCLSFIYAHGSLSEGIYRRAGSASVLSEVLARFRRDAWAVQLSPTQHSEHDIAGVLKRFFRDLPEPLISQPQHDALITAMRIEEEATRHAAFREAVLSLPTVACNTARKLFAHLHFLQTMAHANKMTSENLASVWAPTIMPGALTSNSLETAWSSKEVLIVRELIASFESVWRPTEVEQRREAAVRRVLSRVLSHSVPAAHKAAGDLKAWVHVGDRAACYQVTLTPNKTSSEVCIELCEKAKMDSHLLMLEEVICNESMRRVVHIDEIVLDVVLRWGYWDEEDRKDNYLIVKENKIIHEIEALRHTTSLVCGELRFANETMKSFKLHMFEFQNSKLGYFKDKQGSQKVEEWNIKDIFWYIGHEPKRNPQSRWAITFIPKNKRKRCKERPWFGCTIAGAVTEDQLKWMTAMMFAEHNNILPTPRLIIT